MNCPEYELNIDLNFSITTPQFGAPQSDTDIDTSAPPRLEPSQASSSQRKSSQPASQPTSSQKQSQGSDILSSSPPERPPTFYETPLSLPLSTIGDSSVPPGPQRTLNHTRDDQGLLNCAATHADASVCLPFELPDVNTSAFNLQIIATDSDLDVDGLDDFLSFVKDRFSSCAICQLTGRDDSHHLPNCPYAKDLGTFIWSKEFEERDSNAFEQGVLVLVSLVRILAPRHLKLVSVWIGEDIPGDFAEYKRWCLQPADFLGGSGLKAHQIILALKDLWEDGTIEWAAGSI
ncbi:hypothetical protein TWF730_006204 [Orbilia blumenaviensis]|uniref:Uncharacterized protein n=1 Tax=Orbilia blumenaviensis TaxID=1796055 RepID=A0AAV9VDM3_9PEZI